MRALDFPVLLMVFWFGLPFFGGCNTVLKAQEANPQGFVASFVQKASEGATPVPGVFINPSLASGFAVLPLAQYRFRSGDMSLRPSSTQAVVYLAFNNSRVVGLKQTLFFNKDRWWIESFAAGASIRMKFRGLSAERADDSYTWVSHTGIYTGVLVSYRIIPHLYGGLLLNFNSLMVEGESASGNNQLTDSGFTLIKENRIIPGVRLNYDSRNSLFSPTGGVNALVFSNFALKDFGNYQSYTIFSGDFSHYLQMGVKGVFAYKISARGATGQVPFHEMSSPGRPLVYRGYVSGDYLDRYFTAFQSEWRSWMSQQWGGVLFGGIARAFHSPRVFTSSPWLPQIGMGIRYRPQPNGKMAIRLDVSAGKEGPAIYFGLNEAF
jgi:hypothetical protein